MYQEKVTWAAVVKGALFVLLLLSVVCQEVRISHLHGQVSSLSEQLSLSIAVLREASMADHRRLTIAMNLDAPSPPAIKGEKVRSKSRVDTDHEIYGGKGDKAHLGGFTYKIDMGGISTNVWRFIIGQVAVRSIVDVGCGMGVSSSYFLSQGVDVLCVEGSSDAVSRSLMPMDRIVEHDFTLGPWWPSKTYDAVWSVEFVEHVGRQYMDNYMPIFQKAALVFVTSSGVGGWHHVEVHEKWWWRGRMAAAGFVFLNDLTKQIRNHAQTQVHNNETADHIIHGMDVYLNPRVASLPQHKHLFGGNGCYGEAVDNQNGGRACLGEDALPAPYEALLECSRVKKSGNARFIQYPWDCKPNKRFKY